MQVKARRPRFPTLLLALMLGGAGLPARAQLTRSPPASGAAIYTCIDDQGRTITADRPIAACTSKEQRVLNSDGSLKAVYPPILTVDERAAKEAQERKQAEARAALADAVRRDRNLLARYPSEPTHRKAREAALDTVRSAMLATEARLRELAAERKPMMDEAEFYGGKPLPSKLRAQIDANDAATQAQRNAAINQQAELERVSRLYDAELARLKRLWAGALPGSLGPIAGDPIPSPVAASASNTSSVKTTNLR